MSDQERVQILLSQTVMLLCKNGLRFEKELRVQGLLGITVDHDNVFIVHFNESLANTAADNAVATFSVQDSGNTVEIVTSNAPFTEASVGKPSSTNEAAKPRSPNTINHSRELSIDKNEPLLEDDITRVKVELSSETEDDPVVLVESDTEQDTEAAHVIATGREASGQVWRQNVRKRFHPAMQSCSKRRPSASIDSTPAYDSSDSVVKLEPASLQRTGTDYQNFGYSDSFSGQKWDTSESLNISCRTDQTISHEHSSWQPRETRPSESNLYTNAMNHESVSKSFDKV